MESTSVRWRDREQVLLSCVIEREGCVCARVQGLDDRADAREVPNARRTPLRPCDTGGEWERGGMICSLSM